MVLVREVTTAERKSLQNFKAKLGLFQQFRQDIPASTIEAFLAVALSPGKTLAEYSRDLGVLLQTMSRLLRDLTDNNRAGAEGLGLLEARPSPHDSRAKNYTLTAKGRRLIENLESP